MLLRDLRRNPIEIARGDAIAGRSDRSATVFPERRKTSDWRAYKGRPAAKPAPAVKAAPPKPAPTPSPEAPKPPEPAERREPGEAKP